MEFNTKKILEKLNVINGLANKACLEAERSNIVGAHNLSCANVEYGYSKADKSYFYRAYIEEASPDNCDLCQFIQNYLDKYFFPNVEVVTEW